MRPPILCSVPVVLAALATAQALAQVQSFDVVSIRPRVGEEVFVGGSGAPDRFENPDTTLHFLIRVAYDLFDYQVVGGPYWIDSKRWAVSAKAPAPMSRAAMRPMLR